MMIDERHRKAIEMILSGEHTKADVARVIGISRTTLYSWLEEDEFKAEMDKRVRVIKDQAEKEFDTKLLKAIDLYWELATMSTDNRTKEMALRTWIERALGKTTTKVDISDSRADTSVSDSDILTAIDKAKQKEDKEEFVN